MIKHFHSPKYFVDDLCATNDCGEFGGLFVIYIHMSFNLRLVEHQGDHAKFFNLDVSIKEGTFIYKFNKRNSFPFSFVRIAHKSNIPQNISYSAIKGEFSKKDER